MAVRRPLSLALRLTVLFGFAVAVVFPILGWVMVESTENYFIHQDTEELEAIAGAVEEALYIHDAADEQAALEQRFDDILVGHHDASLHIAGKDGNLIYASPGLDLSANLAMLDNGTRRETIRRWIDADHGYRVLTRTIDAGGRRGGGSLVLLVAVPIDHHLSFLASFRRNLWFMILGSVAFLGLMGWIAVKQGHAPLRDIVDQIRRISANELNTRLSPEAVPDELAELALSFNDMMRRVDEAFHRLSGFNADIAHELRTPIANLMTQTQVGLSRARTPDEYREILYSNMEEYERLAEMVDDMLFLAQSDAGHQQQSTAELDLATEVRALFDFYENWADEQGVTLALSGTATVVGDRLMLRRAMGNLLSNAIRHTPAGDTVQVKLDASGTGTVQILVENPGTAIPSEHIPRLFDRFYRIDPSRQQSDDGVGLGLAIVKSIVSAHDGDICVSSDDTRTQFRMTLPRLAAQPA